MVTVGSWTCAATAGSSCTTGGSGVNRTGTVTLLNGGSATFTANTTLSISATGSLANTASVAVPAGFTEPNPGNNSATDTDTITPALPSLPLLDNFNRANATTLNNGSNWSQTLVGSPSASGIRVNQNQAYCISGGLLCTSALGAWAMWNNPAGGFGAAQGAAFTFIGSPSNTTALFMKASGGSANTPQSYIRVRYLTSSGGQVSVQTTTNGLTFSTLGTFSVAIAAGDRLTARANTDGSVDVWRTTAANVTTYIGHSSPSAFTGGGRIGIYMPNNSRIDDFNGGTLP